jgi:hypothetical protein
LGHFAKKIVAIVDIFSAMIRFKGIGSWRSDCGIEALRVRVSLCPSKIFFSLVTFW